jgi:hypothetical protein
MANREYSNGYYPKIEYWTSKLMEAVNNGNLREIDSCHRMLVFFIQRQWDKEIAPDYGNQAPNSTTKEYKLSSKGLERVR